MAHVKQGEFGEHPMGQHRAEPAREGVETMHPASQRIEGEEIVRSARIDEGAEAGRNDRLFRVIWAAGFFDGEGCVYIADVVSHHSLRLAVTQKYPDPLYILRDLWGGYLQVRSAKNGKNAFCQWALAAVKGRKALEEMLPYLVVKKSQAALGIEYQKSRSNDRAGRVVQVHELNRRESYRLRLMEMKK